MANDDRGRGDGPGDMVVRGRSALAAYSIAACLLAGCSHTGPDAIRSGRLTYNDAIAETGEQQMLLVPIRNRYAQDSHMLSVASVTANVRVHAGAGIDLGFGDEEDFSGNLVPFSASAAYEHNPTISYLPVGGRRYLQQITSPVPVAVVAQLAATLADPAPVYSALVASVNGIDNPDFLFPSIEPDPRFERFVAIMTSLTQAHRLHWIEDSARAGSLSLVIARPDRPDPAYGGEVGELLGLLGVPSPETSAHEVVVPVSLALNGREAGAIGMITRSVMRLIEILSAAVEVPPEHMDDGVAVSYPPLGPMGEGLRIRHADSRPARAAVAVPYRDGWFYIDDRDQNTKQFFRLLGTLWSVSIAENATKASAAPVLTVPVSR